MLLVLFFLQLIHVENRSKFLRKRKPVFHGLQNVQAQTVPTKLLNSALLDMTIFELCMMKNTGKAQIF